MNLYFIQEGAVEVYLDLQGFNYNVGFPIQKLEKG
jgi:hypothetical protein